MSSFLRAPLSIGLRAAFKVDAISHCREFVNVLWKDGAKSVFPSIWLRSSVRDEKFFDSGTLLYRLDKHAPFLAQDSPLVAAEQTEDGTSLQVKWSDHTSTFNSSWLRAQDTNLHDPTPNVIPWTAESKLDNLFQYSRLEEDKEAWMTCLRKYGVAYMRGVPNNMSGMYGILQSIGKLRPRYHPIDVNILTPDQELLSKYDPDNYGFNTHAAHVDHVYYQNPARISCLLISQYNAPPEHPTVNFFIDNVTFLDDLRREHPEAFELLSTIPIRTSRRRLLVEEECDPSDVQMYQVDIHCKRHLIYYDDRDRHYKLRFTMKTAGFELDVIGDKVSASDMHNYYKAFELVRSKLSDPKYHQTMVIEEGMAAMFDNSRVCHGRGPIHPSTRRTLLTGDVVDDVWYSRYRLLLGNKARLDDKWLYGCSELALELLADRFQK